MCHEFSSLHCPCAEQGSHEPKDDLCSLVLLYVYLVEHASKCLVPDVHASGDELYQIALMCDYDGLKQRLGPCHFP